MEDIGQRIGLAPSLRKVAARQSLIVELHQAVENQTVDSLGLPIGTDARIKICRHRFDQKIHDAGLGGDGTGAGGSHYKEDNEKRCERERGGGGN